MKNRNLQALMGIILDKKIEEYEGNEEELISDVKSVTEEFFRNRSNKASEGEKTPPAFNPYAKSNFNLTEQLRIEALDPIRAEKLKKESRS